MSKEKTVWYEPHPVTPDRKAELIAEGYKILDIAFKQESEPEPAEPESEPDKVTEPKRRGRKSNEEKEAQEAQ